jgi:FKBP-type peptidyl-prolyl cis-trans isomerase
VSALRFALTAVLLCACRPSASSETPEPAPTQPVATTSPEPVPPGVPADAQSTASGLRYLLTKIGTTGEPPVATDTVIVRYAVYDEHGKKLAGTRDRDTETVEMSALPPGWAEGMTLMVAGDRAKLWLPEAIAYPPDAVGPEGALVIEVELVDVLRRSGGTPPSTPPDDALRTKSGIAYIVLTPGTGTGHPDANDRVTAHYVGWTASDGNRFDSSYDRGEPIDFTANQVIKGWGEAVRLMVVGEKTRFWIPSSLAYDGKVGRPAGMLIFDIELVGFEPVK